MPHTNIWNNNIPADTDLANTLGDVIRDLKLDITERMTQAGVVWNTSTLVDGDPRDLQGVADTGTVNDYALAPGRAWLLCVNASPLFLTGVSGGVAGRSLEVFASNAAVSIGHQNLGSAAPNRFSNHIANTLQPTPLAKNGYAKFIHDGFAWLMQSHDQGDWLSEPFSAGDFTCSPGTWTVEAADVNVLKHHLRNRCLRVMFKLSNTTIAGSPTVLNIAKAQYGGFTAVGTNPGPVYWYNDGAGHPAGYVEAVGAAIQLYPEGVGGPFTNVTNAGSFRGQLEFEVAS